MEENITLHKHHIVPKHMGGMDEPWNIMELSREDHIWAHKILYKLYGKYGDILAVQLLMEQSVGPLGGSGQCGKDNPNYKNRGKASPLWGKKRPEHSKAMSGKGNPIYGTTRSEETKQKIREKCAPGLLKYQQARILCTYCDCGRYMNHGTLARHKRALEKKNGTTN